jgi:hypothetical protein
LAVTNWGSAEFEDALYDSSCICVGLRSGGEYDLTVYNEADGCGSSNVYKVVVPDCYSAVNIHPYIYRTSGDLFVLAPSSDAFVNFDLMTQYDDYNTFWVAITVGYVSHYANTSISISTVNGTPPIMNAYIPGTTPMDFIGDAFSDALPIDVIDLTAATRITNYQIDSLFT